MSSDVGSPSAPPAASMYARGSVLNMVRSLVVIGGFMAVLFFMIPRPNTVSAPRVDIAALGRQVAGDTHWPIEVPVGLPDGWTPSDVRFLPSTGGLKVWHVGYQTPDRRYAAVEQTMDGTAEWIRAQTNRAPKTGTATAGGRTWDVYVRDIKTQNSLVNRPGGTGHLTTLVTGDASVADLTVFADHLKLFAG
ncbi:MAG: DUF4245 domain-containing protein [Dermatophilaceae bacterium]